MCCAAFLSKIKKCVCSQGNKICRHDVIIGISMYGVKSLQIIIPGYHNKGFDAYITWTMTADHKDCPAPWGGSAAVAAKWTPKQLVNKYWVHSGYVSFTSFLWPLIPTFRITRSLKGVDTVAFMQDTQNAQTSACQLHTTGKQLKTMHFAILISHGERRH